MDPEAFRSLSFGPELQRTCQQRWEGFRRWWPSAKQAIVDASTGPTIMEVIDRVRPASSRLALHVVPLRAAQDLATHDDQHLVSIGLIKDHIRFVQWLAQQD